MTFELFMEKAQAIHEDKYVYSMDTWIDYVTKITVHCNTCHTGFSTVPKNHIFRKHGCPICGVNRSSTKRSLTHDEFVVKAHAIHNNGYSYPGRYVSTNRKIQITHNMCGSTFEQTPKSHLKGQGCPSCAIKQRTKNNTKSHDQFIKQAEAIHRNEFEYLSLYTGDKNVMQFRHKKCQHVFEQKAGTHMRGRGCPVCSSSRGEQMIRSWLEQNSVDFIARHQFKTCCNPKTGRRLIFDFYLPSLNTIIEYDGPQHRNPFRFFGMSQEQADAEFLKCRDRDDIKNQFCRQNGIELVRINFVYDKQFKSKINEILIDLIS